MATLTQVLAELFKTFGYSANQSGELEGTTGRRYAVPLVLEKDTRKIAVTLWLHRQPLGPTFLLEFSEAVRDTGCDGGLIASLGATPDALVVQGQRSRIHVWDSRRLAQELGDAVLRETAPEVWEVTDPLTAARPSRVVDRIHESASVTAAPAVQVPLPVTDAVQEPPFPVVAAPLLAAADTQPAPTLEVPPAFGILDMPLEAFSQSAPEATPVAETALAPTPAPIAAAAPAIPVAPPPKPGRRILRIQVPKSLAGSMAKPKTRTVDRVMLRLTPNYVFDYDAHLLIEGSLNAERRQGRLAVDASMKRTRPWTYALETADLPVDAGDTDEKPVRLAETDAKVLAVTELKGLVTRDVVHEEDGNEWSVVVKKRVELAEDELEITSLGIHYTPVWRVTGRDGSVEIDATSGQFLHEEITVPRTDALLL